MDNIYRDFGNSITKFGFKLITIKAISQESKFQNLIRISQTAVYIYKFSIFSQVESPRFFPCNSKNCC